MLHELSTFDVAVLLVYLATVVGLGVYFARYTRTPEDFTAAGRSLSGWVLGLSLLGGQLSSITFLAYPATAYRYDWNAAVSLLAIVPATAVVAFWLVPFFRRSQEISAYAHFEQRCFNEGTTTCIPWCWISHRVRDFEFAVASSSYG